MNFIAYFICKLYFEFYRICMYIFLITGCTHLLAHYFSLPICTEGLGLYRALHCLSHVFINRCTASIWIYIDSPKQQLKNEKPYKAKRENKIKFCYSQKSHM